jgi:hypothetical protein
MNQAGAPARSRLHRSPSQTPVPDTGRVEPGPDNLRQQGGGDALVVSQDGDEKLVVHEDQSRGLLVLDLGVASCNRRQGASEGAGGDVLGNGVTDRLRDVPPDRPAPRRGAGQAVEGGRADRCPPRRRRHRAAGAPDPFGTRSAQPEATGTITVSCSARRWAHRSTRATSARSSPGWRHEPGSRAPSRTHSGPQPPRY